MQQMKTKEKHMKATGEKWHYIIRGGFSDPNSDLFLICNYADQRPIMEESKLCPARILFPVKISFKNDGENKDIFR